MLTRLWTQEFHKFQLTKNWEEHQDAFCFMPSFYTLSLNTHCWLMLETRYWNVWCTYSYLFVLMVLLVCTGLSPVGLHLPWNMTISPKALWLVLSKAPHHSQAAVTSHCVGLHCRLPYHIYVSTRCLEAFDATDFPWWPKQCFFKLISSV